MNKTALRGQLTQAQEARSVYLDDTHQETLRLFAGFYEGCPELVVDLYANTLVLYGYAAESQINAEIFQVAQEHLLKTLPWVNCVIHKDRSSEEENLRSGLVTFGNTPTDKINENGIWYALDLLMHQDASFYLDTRQLRKWLHENASGWRVLNTFAYTGSLGVAALAGGAEYILQVDRSHKFLSLARQSGMLNHLDIGRMKLQAADFFSEVARLKRGGELFDCVIVDPPFFSTSRMGTVDLVNESTRLINKVRPLVKDGGTLVAINNALFLSGVEYLNSLEKLCADGYLSIEQLIPVPVDVTGFPHTCVELPPTSPAPFNHPTKIVVLRVKRKSVENRMD